MAFSTPSDESQQFLDIGCGTGDFTLEYILPTCQPCRRIVAIDYSEPMLKHARKNHAHEKIVYEYLDIDNDVSGFLKKHGAFQRVYSSKTLQWSRDLPCALRNIADLLVPGGECLLFFYARNFLMDSFKEISRLEPLVKICGCLVPYTAEVLVSPHIAGRPGASYEGFFQIANALYSLLSEHEKPAFLETLSTHLPEWQDMYRKKSGPIVWSAFLVHARKP
ncbi:hypothetical protein MTO96_016063 [Rhipicephalus appendiculatus]